MNRLIHRSWGEGFVAAISLTHHANELWISRFLFCQPIFLGINRGQENIVGLDGSN